MNVKTVIPLALAIVLGLFAAMAAKNMIDKNKNQPAAVALHYTQVVVAKDNIPAGSELRAEDLTVGKMAGDIPAEVVYGNPTEVVGRVLTCALVKGQPIMEPVLAPKGTGSGLQSLIPSGMRAITLEVNEFSAVGGFLVPGCHVDVLASVTVADHNNEPFTRIVVQDLKVVAINSHLTPSGPGAEPEGMHSVTLLATPREAEEINLAAGKGAPRFILRPSKDDTLTPTDGISLTELMSQQHKSDPFADTKQAAATQPADAAAAWNASHTRTIQAIRGGVESAISVQTPARNTSNQMTDTQQEQKSATEGN